MNSSHVDAHHVKLQKSVAGSNSHMSICVQYGVSGGGHMLKQAGNSNMAAAALIQRTHQSSRPYVGQSCKSGSFTYNEIIF